MSTIVSLFVSVSVSISQWEDEIEPQEELTKNLCTQTMPYSINFIAEICIWVKHKILQCDFFKFINFSQYILVSGLSVRQKWQKYKNTTSQPAKAMCYGVKKVCLSCRLKYQRYDIFPMLFKIIDFFFFCVRCRRTRMSESEQKQFKICPHVSKNGVFLSVILRKDIIFPIWK